MTEKPLDFASSKERDKWIIENAEHFTAVRWRNRQMSKTAHPTLAEAEARATELLKHDPHPVMIYAVNGTSDAFIKMVKGN